MTHSPTPWTIKEIKKSGRTATAIEIISDGDVIASIDLDNDLPNYRNQANALIIELAVNVHDDLVFALKTIAAFPTVSGNMEAENMKFIASEWLKKIGELS